MEVIDYPGYAVIREENMFRTIKTKACKRCGGDLYWDRDEYGVYLNCIQCGATVTELAGLTSRRPSPSCKSSK